VHPEVDASDIEVTVCGGGEDHTGAGVVRHARRLHGGVERRLELREKHAGAPDERGRRLDLADAEPQVGARGGEDLLLAARVHLDDGDAGPRRLVPHDVARLHPLGGEALEHLVAAAVGADAGDERHAGAEACGRDRLIGALAAGRLLELRPLHRRARRRQCRAARQVIHVGAADHDHAVGGVSRPRGSRHRPLSPLG